eukprot:TRINITY_DN935_c0_g1_i1.p1 TRINITY_DN935_c0_g1~~TRINITY_DN935_c0_g1_i1.p1  ORF type:complete len:199 (+),score=24.45 TRINITY_DN935_c0_g1_i1:184-780(+)
MAMNQEEVESLADDSFATLEGEGSDGGSSTIPGERNTDRLRRNRESAKRCRLRRKEYIQGVESKCKILEDKNSTLTHENTRLQLLLDQLLAQNAQNGTPISFPDTDTIPCAKRIKIENGVTAADFNTESAAGESNLSAGQGDHHSVFNSINTLDIQPLDSCLDTSDTLSGSIDTKPIEEDMLEGSMWLEDFNADECFL